MCKIQIPEGATLEERQAICFDALNQLNLNDKVEKKDNLTYLSWANAWSEFKKFYPTASFRVICHPETHMPYFNDPLFGIMVFTEITADSQTYSMFLPVMNASNKAMRSEPYSYKVWNRQSRQYEERMVEGATMFDINKAIMRCLVKNMALFGLGLYIYAGEDLPETAEESSDPQTTTKPRRKKAAAEQPNVSRMNVIRQAVEQTRSMGELLALFNQHAAEVEGNPEIKAMFTLRKYELQKSA
ncbi:MAG: DUF1071 domain-containing protein [Bacteroidaceae bacterium]|nr:DUF1071 domain-containing protein [Bacteroidaceae bacterium]